LFAATAAPAGSLLAADLATDEELVAVCAMQVAVPGGGTPGGPIDPEPVTWKCLPQGGSPCQAVPPNVMYGPCKQKWAQIGGLPPYHDGCVDGPGTACRPKLVWGPSNNDACEIGPENNCEMFTNGWCTRYELATCEELGGTCLCVGNGSFVETGTRNYCQ
jgi:hypothetical protein